MKKVFIPTLVLISILYSSCDYIKERKAKSEAEENSKLKKEIIEMNLKFGIREDTILLNFWFGMNEFDVDRHIIELRRKGKLKINSRKEDVYRIQFNEYDSCDCKFHFKYFDYQLSSLLLECKEYSLLPNSLLFQMNIVSIYDEKYNGNMMYIENSPIYEDKKVYGWVRGNRKIEILPFDNLVIIKYVDLIAEMKEDEQKDLNTQKRKGEAIDDL